MKILKEIEALSTVISKLIREATDPLKKRIAELEEKKSRGLEEPDVVGVVERLLAPVSATLDTLPDIEKRLAEAVRQGKDGRDGADGKDGAPGRDGTDGKDGIDGRDGKDGRDGLDGKSVTLDEVAQLLKPMQAEWALDFERRAQAVLRAAIDKIPAPKDGKDGRDGLDGFGFDDMEPSFDGRRTMTLRFTKGEKVKEFSFKFAAVLDCGVWREGNFYEQGDGVTFGGSFWIAQKNTDDKPGTSDSWRLAIKKGRDGKDAK